MNIFITFVTTVAFGIAAYSLLAFIASVVIYKERVRAMIALSNTKEVKLDAIQFICVFGISVAFIALRFLLLLP